MHLTAAGAEANILLASHSVTAIEVEPGGQALDSQRDSAIAANWLGLSDRFRGDLSLIRITSAGTLDLATESLTLATGGQIAINAAQRSLVRQGARLDVSGALNVPLAMAVNNLEINVQGNEQRDSPNNRDSKNLNNQTIWLDRRFLVHVPDGTNGYEGDRWYSQGGLLEVGGYLSNTTHSTAEWLAQGGTVQFSGGDVVTQQGSQINLSGGTLAVQSGHLKQSWLHGDDGRLYRADTAPGDRLYQPGVFTGYVQESTRWGGKRSFASPLLAPQQSFEHGYLVGRDAGRLIIDTPNAVLEGELISTVYNSPRQHTAAPTGADGYGLPHHSLARSAQVIIGQYIPFYISEEQRLDHQFNPRAQSVILDSLGEAIASDWELNTAFPLEPQNTIYLNTDTLNSDQLSALRIATHDSIALHSDLKLADGAHLQFYSPDIHLGANITVPSGKVEVGNVLHQIDGNGYRDFWLNPVTGRTAQVLVAPGVTLTTQGLWNNLTQGTPTPTPYIHGGSVSLRSTGDIVLDENSLINVSAGATLNQLSRVQGGRGGNLRLEAGFGNKAGADIHLQGQLQGHGFQQAGTLHWHQNSAIELGTGLFDAGFFAAGFAHYHIASLQGISLEQELHILRPVLQPTATAADMGSGHHSSQALQPYLPPLHLADHTKRSISQRAGASLILQAGLPFIAPSNSSDIAISEYSTLTVDPGQTIQLYSVGDIHIAGRLNAWGGKIEIGNLWQGQGTGNLFRTVTLAPSAYLDVAGRAISAADPYGKAYGLAPAGGTIQIGGKFDHSTGTIGRIDIVTNQPVGADSHFIKVHQGAVLNASGTHVQLDFPTTGPITLASQGGIISLASSAGLYLDGQFIAHAGGQGAAGGHLVLALDTPIYHTETSGIGPLDSPVRQAREFILAQDYQATTHLDLTYGHARFAAQQLLNSGITTLSLHSDGALSVQDQVVLHLPQAINLYAWVYAQAENTAFTGTSFITAPYIKLASPGSVTGGEVNTFHPTFSNSLPSQLHSLGTLHVHASALLDLQGDMGIGGVAQKYISPTNTGNGLPEEVQRAGFNKLILQSEGEIRLLRSQPTVQYTRVRTPANLSLMAIQLYPGTHANTMLKAGWQADPDKRYTLTIERSTPQTPASLPYSVFGRLIVEAPVIVHQGVLRAPLGQIMLGSASSGSSDYTQHLLVAPGSVTSVSAKGLTIPYGGTIDELSWRYLNEVVLLHGAGHPLAGHIALGGQYIDVADNAIIDLSGGGTLTGAGFVSGRGGSTDARYHPLMQYQGNSFTLPSQQDRAIYAIVPSNPNTTAPLAEQGSSPAVGQQITLGHHLPGLPAGTYTLLPASYALLPGAFRVELHLNNPLPSAAPTAMPNGSWAASGTLSQAHTGIEHSLAHRITLTPADTLRRYATYNETSYADFVHMDAARRGVPRAQTEADGKLLWIKTRDRNKNSDQLSLSFKGHVLGKSAADGYGSSVALTLDNTLEVLADGSSPSSDHTVAILASDLSRLDVNRLSLGGIPIIDYSQNPNLVQLTGMTDNGSRGVTIRAGAHLSAAEILVIAGSVLGTKEIIIEQGATLSTLGQGLPALDSSHGYVFQAGTASVVALSNGRMRWLAPAVLTSGPTPQYTPPISLGACPTLPCEASTRLYSEGSLAFLTNNNFTLTDHVRYGTRHLSLGSDTFHIGSQAALQQAASAGVLPPGLRLTEPDFHRLLQGDTDWGAPAMETLELIAGSSMNLLGNVTLSTLNSQGQSTMDNLLLTTPAIYGYGTETDTAAIHTGHLIWNGSSQAAGDVVQGGAGTGDGSFHIDAQRITLGFGPWSQPDGDTLAARLLLGFKHAQLTASTAFSANNEGKLSFYHRRGLDYDTVNGYQYSGGHLHIHTPLLTGSAGSSSSIVTGGDINVHNPYGASLGYDALNALGAELSLQAGGSLHLDTAVLLPSGKLSLKAQHHLDVGAQAHIDMAGRTVTYFDDAAATQYSWGGDVYLESLGGNITQASASTINLSAINNQAGRLSALASHPDHGRVLLQGQILGHASGHYNAGGTVVPYLSGVLIIQAQTLGHGNLNSDFAALNQRLNTGEVFGLRRFQLLQGDLRVGDELRAHEIDLSLDAGHLSVLGKVDASGAQVGSIRLAAQNGLHLGSQALLDAHGSLARIDSYGQLIYAPNRAIIELNSGLGQLHTETGAQLDLRYGTDDARLAAIVAAPRLGEVHLYAPRLDAQGHSHTAAAIQHGDLAIHIEPGLQLQGAQAVAVYGRTIYDDAPYGTDPAASGKAYQVITQDYLNAKHQQSAQFIKAALANIHLRQHKLAGLTQSYGDILHLRPAIDLVSATTDGDLIVSGDLDLSGHRYASLNPHRQQTALYGSGEPGTLAIRAGGNLSIYGSINDGFAPPPETPDDNGWVLTPGTIAFGGEIIVPGSGVVLGKGTQFASGKTLNYAIPIQPSLAAGVELPVTVTLSTSLDLAAGYVFNGPVYDANGQLLHTAGSILQEATTLAANTQLGAGFKLPARASFHAFIWPAGVPLPQSLALAQDVNLPLGALIPSLTDVKLPHNALSIPLRPSANGQMGQNWAIAAMLPENSLSWNLRVVAGADTQAVDSRSLQQTANGEIQLSDSHYTIFNQRESLFIPGVPDQVIPGGAWFWNALGEQRFGHKAGTPAGPEFERHCSRGYCDRFFYVWNELGEQRFGYKAGTPAGPEFERHCNRGYCDSLGESIIIPGTPDQTDIGATIKKIPVSHVFSVLRTGTGHLDLISQGSIQVQSPYGIYTAGTHTASAAASQEADFNRGRAKAADGTYLNTSKSMAPSDGSSPASGPGYESLVNGGTSSTYAAWYPEQGGNLVLRTGSNLSLDNWSAYLEMGQDTDLRELKSSGWVSNWLWRQASGNTYGIDSIATAWWLNFGTYIPGTATRINNYLQPTLDITNKNGLIATPELIGFTGLGTLGGGNLQIDIRGGAGTLQRLGQHEDNRPRSQALNLAVASTGRVLADGSLLQTGGGDLQLRIAQGWNPNMAARARMSPSYGNQQGQNPNLLGTVTNLRGDTYTLSSTLGGIKQFYTRSPEGTDVRDTRAFDPYAQQRGFANGGITLVLGDSPARLHTRGDLVLTGTADPTRLATPYTLPYSYLGQTYGSGGEAWFSLWTPNTAIQLFSAGGHAAPLAQSYITPVSGKYHHAASDGWQVYPSQLQVIAASGSIFVQHSQHTVHFAPLLLAPSALGQLSLLAKQSIYTAGLSISRSGNLNAINSPFKPAFMSRTGEYYDLQAHNLAENAMYLSNSLFTFGVPNAALSNHLDSRPSRFYAHHGDIIGLESGGVIDFIGLFGSRAKQIWYEGHAPVWMRAGRDIVRSGNIIGTDNRTSMPNALGSVVGKDTYGSSFRTGNLFVHHHANDVSIVEAGRDILFSNFQVAGPGTLEINAGRNISMADQSINPWTREVTIINTRFHSLGPIMPGDHRPGAGIAVQAGMGPGAQWDAFLQHYLDPANAAIVGTPLADQAGKVVKTYHDELITWLEQRYGFEADGDSDAVEQARTYFAALGREQQRIFARDLYFAELRAGGREYNDANGPRAGSYLRGRQAIAALFPTTDAQGQPIYYQGDVLMYGASGVHTDVGGDIQILTPGGAQIYGIEGSAIPPATAGLITRGQGNIQMYSLGSILLGQSRIMTTFGGDILAWSAQGDINAGRGAKTTQIFTPPRRVSGNVNLAALHVVNAENIQVQGESKGIPIAVTVNVGALTSASSAATSAATAAQETLARTRDAARSNQPSQIQVQVLGFGSAQSSAPSQPAHSAKLAPTHYDYDKPVQIVGLGQSLTAASHKLSEDERNAILNP
ncbi:filamentous hemagglutinin family protein [Alcaligenes endophyticus]|uniref:filamentous haemagglutinin family protein n=1 Tax=Alcaligenes endophyticus TaxID=1929088 RepID=UPI003619BD9B